MGKGGKEERIATCVGDSIESYRSLSLFQNKFHNKYGEIIFRAINNLLAYRVSQHKENT